MAGRPHGRHDRRIFAHDQYAEFWGAYFEAVLLVSVTCNSLHLQFARDTTLVQRRGAKRQP